MNGQCEPTLFSVFSDDEIVELEKQLISIRSYPLEETAVADFIVRFLRREGIAAHLQTVTVPPLLSPSGQETVSHNVIGLLEGDGTGPSLMFNGHIDVNATDLAVGGTAFTNFSGWTRDPFVPEVDGGRIYGKGAYDEKAGVCAMLVAAASLKRAGVSLKGNVYLCPVMGHYTESIGTKTMLQSGIRTNYGICTENSDCWIVPAHNGGVGAEVRVRGVNPGTKYSLPETFERATGFENAIRFAQALGAEGVPHPRDGWTTFTPHPLLPEFPNHRIGYIRPVDKALDHIAIGVLIKIMPGMDERTCEVDLRRVLDRLETQHPDFKGATSSCRLWSPPLMTPRDSLVVRALARAHETVTGRPARIGTTSRIGAMGDSGCMGAAGIETCIFGPGVMHDTAQLRGEAPPDESISIQELADAARIMTLGVNELWKV
jgi:acetylornithine deacetylase/succinyl-diaminopimelate desuccinylase-like protein